MNADVPVDCAELTIDILGDLAPAKITDRELYDPKMELVRS